MNQLPTHQLSQTKTQSYQKQFVDFIYTYCVSYDAINVYLYTQ